MKKMNIILCYLVNQHNHSSNLLTTNTFGRFNPWYATSEPDVYPYYGVSQWSTWRASYTWGENHVLKVSTIFTSSVISFIKMQSTAYNILLTVKTPPRAYHFRASCTIQLATEASDQSSAPAIHCSNSLQHILTCSQKIYNFQDISSNSQYSIPRSKP